MKPLKVAICGAGRTGHLNAILFKQLPNVQVSMLTNNQEVVDRHLANLPMQALISPTAHREAETAKAHRG